MRVQHHDLPRPLKTSPLASWKVLPCSVVTDLASSSCVEGGSDTYNTQDMLLVALAAWGIACCGICGLVHKASARLGCWWAADRESHQGVSQDSCRL